MSSLYGSRLVVATLEREVVAIMEWICAVLIRGYVILGFIGSSYYIWSGWSLVVEVSEGEW